MGKPTLDEQLDNILSTPESRKVSQEEVEAMAQWMSLESLAETPNDPVLRKVMLYKLEVQRKRLIRWQDDVVRRRMTLAEYRTREATMKAKLTSLGLDFTEHILKKKEFVYND